MSDEPSGVLDLLGVLLLLLGDFRNMTEELQLPVEQLEKTDVFLNYTGCKVAPEVLVEVPVDVPPLTDLHGLVVLVEVALRLPDAVEEDDLEAGDAEEGHRDADLQVGAQVGLHILPCELCEAVIQGLVKQLLVQDCDLELLAAHL